MWVSIIAFLFPRILFFIILGAERLINHFEKNHVPIAVATSSGKETFEEKVKKHASFFDKFHHIVVGSIDPEVKNGKPAPDIFLVCASRFPEKPSPCEVKYAAAIKTNTNVQLLTNFLFSV